MTTPQPRKPRFIDPPNVLREKVGRGGIDPLRLQRAEEYIDENNFDFTPLALEIMAKLNEVMADCKAGKITGKKAVNKLTEPVMELKATGGMFKYTLVTEIAGIVLNFMENISELNKDVYEIIDAHQNTLSVIVTNKFRGDGGKEGKALANELYAACRRYYTKHNITPAG